ncbi:MAG: hypothetical protein GQ578_04585 [Desulfuromonadaceae bacterium]|nr:hypothetical protein [Desulfuromonadaceae bacterium]
MKATLTILIAGLIFLATPILATAHDTGRHHDRGVKEVKTWSKDRYGTRHDYRHPSRHDRRAKKRLQHKVREQRRDIRQLKRQINRYERRRDARRPHYAKPVVVRPVPFRSAMFLGFPHLVFNIDW